MRNKRYIRDIFTGEFTEVEDDPVEEFEPINERARERVANRQFGTRVGRTWGEDHVNLGMSIAPEQATPERIAKENRKAREHGTGAKYSPDGLCFTPTRAVEAREMARRGYQNNDAGYGDCAGR